MTLVRRTLLAICIALAAAIAVVVLATLDAGSQPVSFGIPRN
jgi:hypothetical protein